MLKIFQERFFIFLFITSTILYASQSFAANPSVVQPNGGETIRAGDTYDIQWSASVDSVKYNIKYSLDNGATWGQINSGMVTGTNISWNVPEPGKNKTKCLVKVIGYDSSGVKVGADVSDATFTLSVLNVTSPAGGATVDAGSITDITWATDTLAAVSYARLLYTIDDGLTWNAIKTISGNPGTYRWTVTQLPSTSSGRVQVQLLEADKSTVAAAVSANFTIKATAKTSASFGGEYFMTQGSGNRPSYSETGVYDVISDGNGHVDLSTIASSVPPGTASTTYSGSPSGRFELLNIYDTYYSHGILSTDNNIYVVAETNIAADDHHLALSLGIKASTGLDNSALSGTYRAASIYTDGTTSLDDVSYDGAGNAVGHCISYSGGICYSDFSYTYSVSPDGRITTDDGENGVVSSDGQLFTFVKTDPAQTLAFRVGIKKSSGLSNATLSGKFFAATLGTNFTHGNWVDFYKLTLNGAGAAAYTELFTSWPPAISNNGTYTVGTDGTLSLNGAYAGMVLGNGQGYFIVGTDASHNEVNISIGLKAAK